MVALTSVILYSTSLIPISTIAILTVASAIIPVCIIRSDVKTATFVYFASSLLAFFLVPINISIMYILFFGIYGIIKYYIERINKITLENILKLIFFNIVFIIGFIIMQTVLGVNIIAGLQEVVGRFIESSVNVISIIILWVVAQPVFLAYDYAMTLIISFYVDRIHKNI